VTTAAANGIDINYVDEGHGEPLVLVHNVIANLHMFDLNFPTLSKHFRTIAYDLRGFGQSSHTESGLDFDTLAEDLYQLLKGLDVSACYLLGQASLGRGVVLTFFLKHPEMVKALMLSSGGTLASHQPEGGRPTREGVPQINLREVAEKGGMMAAFEARHQSMQFWTPRIIENPEIYNRFKIMYEQTSLPAMMALPHPITQERHKEIVDQLNRQGLPVMQMCGGDDDHPENVFNRMRQAYSRTHCVMIPFAGHYLAIENPDDFNRVIMGFIGGVEKYGW
jgi:pimeloyl-ACP methyl ester carboxylesterase